MKVRISTNSIRFRLKQSEVKKFSEIKVISEVTAFGPLATDKLSFILQEGRSSTFQIAFQSGSITVSVPPAICRNWTDTDQIGFEELIDTGKGEKIKVLVEKDFACLDASPIENIDTYPNPNATC